MKKLQNLTKEEYSSLLRSGLFWELFPKATGIYEDDIVQRERLNEENIRQIIYNESH